MSWLVSVTRVQSSRLQQSHGVHWSPICCSLIDVTLTKHKLFKGQLVTVELSQMMICLMIQSYLG